MPRLYREAPLNSIWEGSGNVIALDVLRALAKDPGALDRMLAEIRELVIPASQGRGPKSKSTSVTTPASATPDPSPSAWLSPSKPPL